MKKFLSSAKFFVMAMTITSLTSCEIFLDPVANVVEDKVQSMAFAGQWTGDFGMYYTYYYNGRTYTFDSYDTDIVFYPQFGGANYGYGKQVDYYQTGPYSYEYHSFNWDIRNGVVYLTYPSDPSLNTSIYDYRMTNDYFYGYFGSSKSRFSLRKIADYYDWTPYYNTYGYGTNSGWRPPYYAPSNVPADSIAAATDTIQNGIISHGNRWK